MYWDADRYATLRSVHSNRQANAIREINANKRLRRGDKTIGQIPCEFFTRGPFGERKQRGDFFLVVRVDERLASERKKKRFAKRTSRQHRDGAESRGEPQKVRFDTKSTLLRPGEQSGGKQCPLPLQLPLYCFRLPVRGSLSSRERISPVASSSVSDRVSGFLFVHLMDNTRINKGPRRCFPRQSSKLTDASLAMEFRERNQCAPRYGGD